MFGARGASTFLSRSTAVLAAVFFVMSLLMGIYLHPTGPSESDLGVMAGATTPAATTPVVPPAANGDVPNAPAVAVPQAAPLNDKPAPTPAATPAGKSDAGGHKAEEPQKK